MYLNAHTYYSFHYGTLSPEALLRLAAVNGFQSLVLTDINNTSGCLSFVREAARFGVRPILGIDFRNGIEQKFVGIAQNNDGFQELNTYLSYFLHSGEPVPARAKPLSNCFIVYPFSDFYGSKLEAHEFLGISVNDLWKLERSPWRNQLDKLVILHTISFSNKKEFNAHRLLRAIDKNTLLSMLPVTEQGLEGHRMLSRLELQQLYSRHPHIIHNTERLIERCSISFDFGTEATPKNKITYKGSREEDYQFIRQKCEHAIPYRYHKKDFPSVYERLDKELRIIKEKNFLSYFLINWDILRESRRQGFFYVGRGSGANSIVAYLLRITDVDPIELDLYFERFINLYRQNPPDFDIDFSWRDREYMTQYIFDKFGAKDSNGVYNNVALLATYNTFKQKSVIRELGKVFGLPPAEINKLQKDSRISPHHDQLSNLVLKYSRVINNFPSHLSIHAGGILITEKPIYAYTATSLPPKNFPLSQFSMLEAEDVGLYKFDILSQRGLGKIKDALSIIRSNHPEVEEQAIDIRNVSMCINDEKVKSLLRNGEAIGCFYVESPAMRMLLKKLKADHYLGLVAASSIIRPGVAKSGMMREYILRFQNSPKATQPHPILEDIMPDTFGVMVYQEDVIKVAHHFAGLTLAEADVLRRGMSGKYRSREEFIKVRDRFFENCLEKGHSTTIANDVWRQIESFAGYAFSKGHSASYAVESYQALYLKAHYPLEYMVAVLNNGGGFYRPELYVHEARMYGAIIEAPCVNKSGALCSIEGNTIYLGLIMIQEIESDSVIDSVLNERRSRGPFSGLSNFCQRVPLAIEKLKTLIRVGAFRFTNKTKKELLWEAHFLLSSRVLKESSSQDLFQTAPLSFDLPSLDEYPYENAFDEIELLGFSLCNPFELLNAKLSLTTVADFVDRIGEEVEIHGYLINVKKTSASFKTKTSQEKKEMFFGTFLDYKGSFIDTVHFPLCAEKYPFRGTAIYKLTGKVVEEFDFLSLEISEMLREPYKDQSMYS